MRLLDYGAILSELQDIMRLAPMVILGCGSTIAAGLRAGVTFPGMSQLADKLRTQIPTHLADDASALEEWRACEPLLEHQGLERALHAKSVKNETLLTAIVEIAAELIQEPDAVFRERVSSGDVAGLPLRRLLCHLANSTAPRDRAVHVATPNYDHLVEYACDDASIPCITGFRGSVVRRFVADVRRSGIYYPHETTLKKRPVLEPRMLPHVRLYKPHGSLSWFMSGHGPLESHARPKGMPRIMVTPGDTKYRLCLTTDVLDQHRTWANAAVRRARAFLIYGYGFNDEHLQTALVTRLANGAPAIILTRDLSDAGTSLVGEHPHVWALDAALDGGTRCQHEGHSFTVDCDLWDLDRFLHDVLET